MLKKTIFVTELNIQINKFLTFIRLSLEEYSDWDEVSTTVEQIMHEGISVPNQQLAYNHADKLEDVVDYIVK
ncbi:MAG: hypothetical protein AAF349_18860 [Cyanobacteria bacterium P01_A01_bin.68]